MIIEKILAILQMQTEAASDLFAITFSSYPEARRKILRTFHYGPTRFKDDWAENYKERQRFYALLNYLKREGFIEKKKKAGRVAIWKITATGLNKLRKLKETQKDRSLSIRTAHYRREEDKRMHVVIYDIPEQERRKRIWLRAALSWLGFSYLQKSVWIGKNKIPEKFIRDIRERNMLQYIHIFAVSREGTIKEVTARHPNAPAA